MARRPAPGTRDRILDTAQRLFYEHGVRAVGMQQIIDECGIGKSLLYREFASKDELVVAYLERLRGEWDMMVEDAFGLVGDDPAERLVALGRLVARQIAEPDYRGCAFRNCYGEFADPRHPVSIVAGDQLRSVRELVFRLAARSGAAEPNVLGEQVWLVIEGMYASGAHADSRKAGEVGVSLINGLVGAAVKRG